MGLAPHVHGSGQPLSLWLVLGPAALLVASTALFSIDAVARYWDLSEPRPGWRWPWSARPPWPTSRACGDIPRTVWPWPWSCGPRCSSSADGTAAGPRAALLLGVGIAFQPLAILGVAPVLTRIGWQAAVRVSWRLVLPSAAVLVAPLIGEPHRTLFVLVHQPFLPHYISYTPLTRFAPVLGPGLDGGGPTRLISLLLSAGLAVAVCRRRHDLATVLTMTTVAFFLRVLLETELNWYYVWPVAALCLLLWPSAVVWRGSAVCSAALAASMVLGNHDAIHHVIALVAGADGDAGRHVGRGAALPRAAGSCRSGARHGAAGPARPVECGTMAMPVRAGQRSE